MADIIDWIDERSQEWVGLYLRDMRGQVIYGRNGKSMSKGRAVDRPASRNTRISPQVCDLADWIFA